MGLYLPKFYTDFSAVAQTNGYAWIAGEGVDLSTNSGQIVVNGHPDEESANAGLPPIFQVPVTFGQTYDGTTFPPLDQVVKDNQEAFDSIWAYLYSKLKTIPPFREAQDEGAKS